MVDATNSGFSKIQDTIHGVDIVEGLISAGVVPKSFRSYVCTVDLAGLNGSATQALVDDRTGQQIIFSEGDQVILLSGGASVPIVDANDLTVFQVGLAPTATGAAVETLSNAGTGAILTASTLTLTASDGGVVGSTNVYGVISTTAGTAITSGEAKIFIAVV